MKHWRHSTFIVFCLLVSVLMAVSPTARQAQSIQLEHQRGSGGSREAPKHLEAIATRLVAKQKSIHTEDLIVSNSNVLNFPLTGKTAYSYTMTDIQTGFPHSITLDEKGQEVNEELLLAEELAARTGKYGKFDPDLLELVQRSSMEENIRVIISLKISPDSEKAPEEPDMLDRRPWEVLSEEEKRASELKDKEYRKQKDEYLARRTKRLTAPLIEWLRNLEYEVKADAYIPIIYVTLPVSRIWQVAAWDAVEQIALDGAEQPKLEVSRVAIGADIVENRGNGAFAIQVAQVESLGGRIVSTTGQSNPYLSGTIQDTTFVCSTQHDHAAWVAGVIRCTNILPPGTRGISPGVTLWAGGSCGGIQSELQNRTTAAADWGAKVINRSSGLVNNSFDLTSNDRFYDSIVSDRDITMVMVASNETGLPGCPSGVANVQTPAKGYNVITVGSFNDMNTTNRADDRIHDCSSWLGPNSLSGDREKPEIVAPGVDIQTTKATGPTWFTRVTGTSVAAPHVTGTVATMIWRDPRLGSRPKEVKAILLVSSAFDIVTGGTARDGAGGISTIWADDVTRDFFGAWGRIPYDCHYPQDYLAVTFPLQAGLRTRVAIVWNTNPGHAEYFSRPSSNLDLIVKDPAGTVMAPAFGKTKDNTYEWIEFNATTSGNYTLYLHREHCNPPTGRIAYAY